MFPKKHTGGDEFVEPYTFAKQAILAVLDQDGRSQPEAKRHLCTAPQSAIVSISSGYRGISKTKVVVELAKALGGYELTLDLNADAKKIKEIELRERKAIHEACERPICRTLLRRHAGHLLPRP